MNRALLIILIPAVLVAAGYMMVLRMMGMTPGYGRLAVAVALFAGGIYWLTRRSAKRAKAGAK
jgi:uncharacterized membrane protein